MSACLEHRCWEQAVGFPPTPTRREQAGSNTSVETALKFAPCWSRRPPSTPRRHAVPDSRLRNDFPMRRGTRCVPHSAADGPLGSAGGIIKMTEEAVAQSPVLRCVYIGRRVGQCENVVVAQNFLPCERDQQYLMPPSLTEWLPEDHLVWFVIDAVDQMDLSGLRASYRADGWGRAAYDPAMMVAVMLYAYCIGERSSRRIERRCLEDVAFRVLAANQQPDHATIARFRQRHAEALAQLFVEVLRLCQRAGLVRVGLVALDGTKMAGAASLDANRTREQIQAQVAQMLAEAEAVDAAEDADHDGGGQPPAVLRGRADRLRRLAEAKAQLDAEDAAAAQAHAQQLQRRAAAEAEQGRKLRGRKPKPPQPNAEARRNISDPDSRIMKTSGGWMQGYNGQALVPPGRSLWPRRPSTTRPTSPNSSRCSTLARRTSPPSVTGIRSGWR
jgi:transposase